MMHEVKQRQRLIAASQSFEAPKPCSMPWRRLDHLPLYGFGVSAGGAFLLKLPRYMKASRAVRRTAC